jgi:hypothetical protein
MDFDLDSLFATAISYPRVPAARGVKPARRFGAMPEHSSPGPKNATIMRRLAKIEVKFAFKGGAPSTEGVDKPHLTWSEARLAGQ